MACEIIMSLALCLGRTGLVLLRILGRPADMHIPFFIGRSHGLTVVNSASPQTNSSIDLERSLDAIWASFSQSCRRGIKEVKAYSPEIQQTDDVSRLLDIWRGRFSELGLQVPLLSDSYLKELVAAFPQDVNVYNLIIDGILATAIACYVLQKERYHWWIEGVNARKDLSAIDYPLWDSFSGQN